MFTQGGFKKHGANRKFIYLFGISVAGSISSSSYDFKLSTADIFQHILIADPLLWKTTSYIFVQQTELTCHFVNWLLTRAPKLSQDQPKR